MLSTGTDLSDREKEILILLTTGASNKEIARQLSISTNTVKVHLRNIFAKIGVVSRTEAAMYAINAGMLHNAPIEVTIPDQLPEAEETTPQVESISPDGLSALPLYRKHPRLIIVSMIILLVFLPLLAILINFYIHQSDKKVSVTNDQTRWKSLAVLPQARYGLAVAGYQGYLYAIGGETQEGITGIAEVYSISEDHWESLPSKPTPVKDASAAVIGGKLYIPGGMAPDGLPTDRLDIFDLTKKQWTSGEPLPIPLSAYSLANYEGKLFLFGGWDGNRFGNNVFEYDPGLDKWIEKAPMPTARGYTGAAVANGKIYVIGGFDGRKVYDLNEIYSPDLDLENANPWSTGMPMPTGRYGMGLVGIAEIIHLVGGVDDKGKTPDSLEYFPLTDTWQDFGALGVESWIFPGVVPVGTQLHILGGSIDGAQTDRNLSYQAIYILNFPVVP